MKPPTATPNNGFPVQHAGKKTYGVRVNKHDRHGRGGNNNICLPTVRALVEDAHDLHGGVFQTWEPGNDFVLTHALFPIDPLEPVRVVRPRM